MNISPEEAARALREFEASRSPCGARSRPPRPSHLWLWGIIWIAMSVLNWSYDAVATLDAIWWISVGGVVAIHRIGPVPGPAGPQPVDRRFLAVCAILLRLRIPGLARSSSAGFQSIGLGLRLLHRSSGCSSTWSAGIWFDNFWLLDRAHGDGAHPRRTAVLPGLLLGRSRCSFGFILLGSGFYIRASLALERPWTSSIPSSTSRPACRSCRPCASSERATRASTSPT